MSLVIANVTKSYGNVQALRGVSMELKKGEVVGLLGPNGAGKSTLMRSIATLQTRTSGSMTFDGIDIDSEPEKILARTMSRDNFPDEDDYIFIAIDTFFDRRNGYSFAVNPNGIRYDALITNNSFAGSSWDTIWRCKRKDEQLF